MEYAFAKTFGAAWPSYLAKRLQQSDRNISLNDSCTAGISLHISTIRTITELKLLPHGPGALAGGHFWAATIL